MQRFYFLLILSFFIALPVSAASVEVYTPSLRPGDTFVAGFSEKPLSVVFNTSVVTPFPYAKTWRVVTPLSLGAKTGPSVLVATFPSGKTFIKMVSVVPRQQNVIVLPVPEKMNQTPTQLVQNLAKTNTSIKATVAEKTTTTLFTSPFALPLSDNRKISSPFGEVRQTGEERITHLGVDFDQPKGSLVVAINSGVVAKAYVDPIYGNSVFVDHGQGIFTLYLHLDTMRVKAGQKVFQGTVLGTLGESGLASAPHLHLSIKINGVSVDPMQFVRSFR